MLKYNNVLVGVQFRQSDPDQEAVLTTDSKEAVGRAMMLAEQEGSRLCFVTVFETLAGDPKEVAVSETDADAILPAIRKKMDELVADAVARKLDAGWEFLFGRAWKELCAKVHTDKHDLLVVGTRKRSGFARTFLGSTSKRVSHFAPCPVWVVQHQKRQKYESIVIATDLSEIGEDVLRHGLSLASWNESAVHILHAVPNWYEGQWYRAGYAKDAIIREHEEEKLKARRELGEQLSKVMEEMALRRTPEIHVETGSPEHVIWRAVNGYDANLLVMGMVGRSGMKRYLIGDTAEKLLPEVPCSLLTVKPRDFQYNG